MLTFFASSPAHDRFVSSTRQALQVLGLSGSDLLCHFHTKNFTFKRGVWTNASVFFYQEIEHFWSVLIFAKAFSTLDYMPVQHIYKFLHMAIFGEQQDENFP